MQTSASIDDPRSAAGSFSMADVHRLSAHAIKLMDMPKGGRLPFYCTPPAAVDAVILDPTPKDLVVGIVLRFLPRLKLLRSERPLLLVSPRAMLSGLPWLNRPVRRNEDLQTNLEYFNKDYDEELEMEPRPKQIREVTPPLYTRSPRARRQRERVVGFEEAPNRERSRIGRNIEGNGPSEAGAGENERREMNLPHSWQPTWEGTKMTDLRDPP
ncbi:hypothetical protein Tco_1447036 [Tanacetum coccineum]